MQKQNEFAQVAPDLGLVERVKSEMLSVVHPLVAQYGGQAFTVLPLQQPDLLIYLGGLLVRDWSCKTFRGLHIEQKLWFLQKAKGATILNKLSALVKQTLLTRKWAEPTVICKNWQRDYLSYHAESQLYRLESAFALKLTRQD